MRPLGHRRRSFQPCLASAQLEGRQLPTTTLPAGFNDSTLVDGLVRPTSMEVAPDGRIFVTEQDGRLRIVTAQGQLLAQPFLTLNVDNQMERGLLGVTFDPKFKRNGYVYVYYTVPNGLNTHNRVSRFTARGNVAVPGSEKVLIDIQPPTPDLPLQIHNGGAMHFGPDGKLYIAVGDHYLPETAAQDLTNLHGKFLRINRDGTIPPSNPFYRKLKGVNRAIYAYGFRNPFTFSFQPSTGRMFVDDVQADDFEEIDDVKRGGNYGWPYYQANKKQMGKAPKSSNLIRPIVTYAHGDGPMQGCAVTGGIFYEPARGQFPGKYEGQYFFADFCNQWIHVMDPNTHKVSSFATGVAPFLVDLDVGRNGTLYYLSRGSWTESGGLGSIHRIQYQPNDPPRLAHPPENELVSVGHSATFSVSPSGTAPFRFQWQRNGQNIPGATASVYTTAPTAMGDNGAHYRVIITNGIGKVTSADATLAVTASQPPIPVITSPDPSLTYHNGDTVVATGDATDYQGNPLPDGAFSWQVLLHHNDHYHPVVAPTGNTRSVRFFTGPHGDMKSKLSYLILLTVTDPSSGVSTTVTREIYPAMM
jgi:glucose/arabinose dehydrogenase